jgi:hypothetical protein
LYHNRQLLYGIQWCGFRWVEGKPCSNKTKNKEEREWVILDRSLFIFQLFSQPNKVPEKSYKFYLFHVRRVNNLTFDSWELFPTLRKASEMKNKKRNEQINTSLTSFKSEWWLFKHELYIYIYIYILPCIPFQIKKMGKHVKSQAKVFCY